jgi:hypothetical protein
MPQGSGFPPCGADLRSVACVVTMPARSALRASDTDRDAVAERLRKAATEGRLSTEELEHRLHAALSARTYGQLDELTHDLPGSKVATHDSPAIAIAKRHPVATAVAVAFVALTTLAALAAFAVAGGSILLCWFACYWIFGGNRRHHRHHHRGPLPPGPGGYGRHPGYRRTY